ncbi:hypothetical protein D9M69_625500 [compost metagenome]
MAARCRILGFLHFGEDPAAIVEIPLAGFAQMYAAGRARQQRGTDAFFQRCHRARHAGCRHPQAPRRRREPLFLGDHRKDLHFLKSVHWLFLDQ